MKHLPLAVAVFAVLLGVLVLTRSNTISVGTPLYRQAISTGTATSTTVTPQGVTVVAATNADRQYLYLQGTGGAPVTCVPSLTTSSYGFGWYLSSTTPALSFDSVLTYTGPVSCISSATNTTVTSITQ